MDSKIKKTSGKYKRGVAAVFAMQQADRPTLAEFLAAWELGFIDITKDGESAVREAMQAIGKGN